VKPEERKGKAAWWEAFAEMKGIKPRTKE